MSNFIKSPNAHRCYKSVNKGKSVKSCSAAIGRQEEGETRERAGTISSHLTRAVV